MSFCMRCKAHATFSHTVFQGTTPTTIKLCDPCASTVDVEARLAQIKGAPDKETKKQAVAEFVAAVAPPASDAGAGADQARA